MIAITAVLAAGVAMQNGWAPVPDTILAGGKILMPVSAEENFDDLSILRDKKQKWQQLLSQKQSIDESYGRIAPIYAEHIGSIAGLVSDNGIDDKVFVEKMIQSRLEKIGVFDNLRVLPSEPENLAPGVRKILADISFSSNASKEALFAFMDLGNPKSGMAWKNVTLATDRGRKEINFSGRVSILLAEVAE